MKDEGPGAGGAPMDPFEMFFGGGRRQQPQGPPRGPDTVVPLRVSLRDLYEGSTIAFAHHKRKVCTRCHGSGAYSKDHYRPCPVCGGRGVRVRRPPPSVLIRALRLTDSAGRSFAASWALASCSKSRPSATTATGRGGW